MNTTKRLQLMTRRLLPPASLLTSSPSITHRLTSLCGCFALNHLHRRLYHLHQERKRLESVQILSGDENENEDQSVLHGFACAFRVQTHSVGHTIEIRSTPSIANFPGLSGYLSLFLPRRATIYEPSIQNTIFALESMVGALEDFAWSFIL